MACTFGIYELHEAFKPEGGMYLIAAMINKNYLFYKPNPTSTHTPSLQNRIYLSIPKEDYQNF